VAVATPPPNIVPRRRRPIIVDIEASGFGTGSYPIEVGVVLNDGRKYCSLIAPAPGWTHWDEDAERVHCVSRDMLEAYGKPALEVARSLNELLPQRIAYSDGWVVDKTWLDQLYFAAGIPSAFSLSALEMILTESQMEIWHATKDELLRELGQHRHRASFDAYVVQETWQRTWSATSARKAAR
jgi:hypothetical protein